MKKVLLSLSMLAFVGSASVFTSCEAIKDKVKEEANIDFDYNLEGANATFDIPVIYDTTLTTYPDTATVPSKLKEDVEALNAMVTLQNIKSVTITEAKLHFNNCDNYNNASNFETALLLFYSNTNPEVRYIASNDVIPDQPGEDIMLVPDQNINLIDYLSSSTELYYVSGVNLRRPTTKVLNATLHIKYNLFGNTGHGE